MAEFVLQFGKDASPAPGDGRLDAPSFHRNHGPIREVFSRHVAPLGCGTVLEVGSGSGQHVTAFAEAFPDLVWWPSDPNEAHRQSIEAWRGWSGLGNIRAPAALDASLDNWPDVVAGLEPGALTAMLCINVTHIAPWAVTEGLMRGDGRHLRAGGHLLIYGPFSRGGAHTAASNAAFDQSLRARNPEWGVRDAGDVERIAVENGLSAVEVAEMPANNLVLVFVR